MLTFTLNLLSNPVGPMISKNWLQKYKNYFKNTNFFSFFEVSGFFATFALLFACSILMKIVKVQHKLPYIFVFILFAIIIGYFIGFLWVFNDSGYAFYHVDELTYYNSARMFAQTHAVKAPLCFMEAVSPVFQTHWYGINYHLLYGGIAKITGFHPFIFIVFNVILLFAAAWLIFKIKSTLSNRLVILIALLAAYPVVVNCFNFFPEILLLFFGIVLSCVLYQMQQYFGDVKKFNRYKMLFIFLVLVFMTFRITTIFWLVALLPFSRSRKHFFIHILIGAAGFIVTLMFMQYFTAPAFVLSLGLIDKLKSLQLIPFLQGLWENWSFNLKVFFKITLKEYPTLVFLLLFFLTTLAAIINKKRLLFAAVFVTAIYFIVLTALYNASFFYLSKQTAITIPLMIMAIVLVSDAAWSKVILIVLFLSGLYYNAIAAYKEIYFRKLAYGQAKVTYYEQVQELQKLATFFIAEKPAIVEILHYEHNIPNYVFYAHIPVATAGGDPIIYTASIKSKSLFPNLAYCERFPRYDKLPVHYVLSRDSLDCVDVHLLFDGAYFNFYEDKRRE